MKLEFLFSFSTNEEFNWDPNGKKNADITVYFKTLQPIKEQITKTMLWKNFLDSIFMKTSDEHITWWLCRYHLHSTDG